ncbi:MAG TPA: polysaccharide export protein EpsE [Steroidobacteraceae bacterium]|jgi:polysaccharide export outer membrane protein|nr:polysaccharide export protein EpsE [Steroidobacteraceae bacterium]
MSAECTVERHNPQGLRRLRRWRGLLALFGLCAFGFAAAPARAQPEYLLAPGDILKISVFKNPDLSLDVRVSESGAIGYPLIGSVPVKGLTLPAAEAKISQMLRDGGFVVNPQVNILLTEGFGNLVSVIGEVNKAGRYSVDAAGGHVSGMLAAAGGVSPTGGEVIWVSGMRNGKQFRRDVDIVKMSATGNTADDIELYGGDTVYVSRAPMFYIYGQVQKPGQYRLERGMTVIQALAEGGGLTGKGTQRGIVRHRRDANGKIKEEGVSMDENVQDMDVIYVKESLF